MKSSVRKLTGTAKEINIDLPGSMVEETIEEVLEEMRKSAKVPGFRPGKAPMDMIRKKHHTDAIEEAKQRLIPRAYQQVIEKHDIDPVSYPEISDVDMKDSGALSFKARVDCQPEINLKQYKALKVSANKIKVDEKEVDEALERLRSIHAEFIDTDRPLEKGDFAISNVESFVGGKSVSKKRENMWIEVSKEASMLGIGEKLEGLRKGDNTEIDVTLPEGYPDKKYAGKKAVFKVEINQTREKKLPPMDDEMAKKAGMETMEELRGKIRDELISRKEDNEKISMKNQILGQLIKKHRFELPATMVSRQLKVLMDRAENELLQKGLDKDTIESHKDKLTSQLSKEAEDKVRIYFILEEVSRLENVEVTEEEMDSWIASLASSYNKPFDEVKKYYGEHALLDGLREQIREDKALEFLLSEAAVSTKE